MFKIKTDRTYQYPVAVTYREGNDEKQGEFIGIFKTLNMAELERVGADDEKALDVVFVGAEGVEMEGHDGQSLSGDDMLAALRSDPDISQAIWAAYQDSYAKKGQSKT
jgi:hypothetical protein